MAQDQEVREHQQMKEVWSLWQMLLKKIAVQHLKNYLEPRGVPATSVFGILTKDLKKRNISAQSVPHCLIAEQKQKCLDISTLLKERFDVEDQTFLRLTVATYWWNMY